MAIDATTQKVSEVISTFRPCKRFRPDDSKTHVTSLDFDDSGELAIICRNDDTLQIYNCKEGKHAKDLKSQKYGAHLARFTHQSSAVLYASTKVDDGIRYLSTHDNSYIRYFRGHTAPVTSLTVSPSDDSFATCSLDNTVRLWDIRSPNARGQLNITNPMFASYDPSSSVLAVASPITHSIMLYDAKNFEKPPFASFDLLGEEERFSGSGKGRNWSKLEFSNDGKSLLVATTGNGHFILDAFDGSLRHFCARPTTKSSSPRSERRAPAETSSSRSVGQGDVSFSPDGAYLVGGNGDEGLAAWDMNGRSGEEGRLETCAEMPVPDKTQGRCEVVGYNPRHNMIVSADREILLWLPDAELAG